MRLKICACIHVLALSVLAFSCGASEYEVFETDDDLAVSAEEGELRSNNDPGRLVVYSNNIENMLFDWKDLVHYMAEDALRPDVFLAQQVSGAEDMQRLTRFMSRRMGVDYTGIVAQKVPADRRFQGQVIPRPRVTTGIIFRSKRFELVSRDSWMPYGRGFKNQPQTCDERSPHSGYETLRVKLFDKVAKKYVVLVSLRHWTWEPCSTKNVANIVERQEAGPQAHPGLGTHAALHIVAGDFNDKAFDADGSYACWYREMNGALAGDRCSPRQIAGFNDPMFRACRGSTSCMKARGGIDFIFARRSDGKPVKTSNFDIISADEAHRASRAATGGDGLSNIKSRDGYNDVAPYYSQHRARKAYVFYE